MVLLGTGLLQIHWMKVTQVLEIYAYTFAATVEKMVILAKSLHYTATVVNGGKKS